MQEPASGGSGKNNVGRGNKSKGSEIGINSACFGKKANVTREWC